MLDSVETSQIYSLEDFVINVILFGNSKEILQII